MPKPVMPTPSFSHGSRRIRRAAISTFLLLAALLAPLASGTARAQAAADPPAVAADAGDPSAPITSGERGIWATLKAGGLVGLIIILLSVGSLSAIIYHAITIRRERLIPSQAVTHLDSLIKDRQVDEAIDFCEAQKPESLLTDVVLAGLRRYKGSEFGFAEYRAAAEEEGEEQTAQLYRQTEVLSIIGAIAPMLGLLGTVQGMIEAFNAIAATGGMAKPADLADAISKALVTTLLGLMVAIPTLVALSLFRTRIDSLVAEAGKRVEQVLQPLGRPK